MDKLRLLVCSYYAREAAAALAAAELGEVTLVPLPAVCELPPARQAEARQAVRARELGGQAVWLGGCWEEAEPVAWPGAHCLTLVASAGFVDHLARTRHYVVTPGWLAGWPQRLAAWGFDQPTARACFAEFADRLALLDTGVNPQAPAQLQVLADYLGLAGEHIPIGLDHFQLRLLDRVARRTHALALAERSAALVQAHRNAADYALALDLLGELARLRTEAEVIQQIRQVVEMLVGPRRQTYVAGPAACPTTDGAPLEEEAAVGAVRRWLTEAEAAWAWVESGDGFRLRLRFQGEVMGGLEVAGLPFPERREHYRDMLLGLTPLFALALANARTYERLVAAQMELNEHAARLEERVRDRSSRLMEVVADLETEVAARQRLSEALQETVENLETVLNASPLMISITEPATGRVLYANARFEDLTGYSRAEALGRTTLELGLFNEPADREAIRRLFESEPQVRGTEVHFRHRSGRRWVGRVRGALIRYKGQVSLLGMVSDITERYEADQLLRETQALLAQRVGELEQRTQELTALTALIGALQQAGGTPAAYALIAAHAPALFPEGGGAVWLAAERGRPLAAMAGWGAEPAGEPAAWGAGCPLLTEGRFSVQADPDVSPACRQHLGRAPGALCLPIAVEGARRGLLHLRLRPAQLHTHAPLAAVLAEQLGLALSNLRLRDELRERAIHDPLTGLYNRYYMQESLERELRRAVRLSRPVSLAMLDLDHFKAFNDRLGHPAGDELLRALGAYLLTSVRGGDIACRYGGEEFLVILPEAGLEAARERAEQWRKAIPGLELSGEAWPVTVSIGVACWPEQGRTAEELIAAADRALYQAKEAGRDCVICAA